jgi:hypothetical protein
MWGGNIRSKHDKKTSFVINVTDFSSILEKFRKQTLSDKDIVKLVAFYTVEQILVWLSSLEDKDRTVYVDGLTNGERALVFAILKAFYLSVSETDRSITTANALKLLNSAWTTKSAVWASKQWGDLSKIIANVVNAFSKQKLDSSIDIAAPAEEILNL